MHASFKQQTLCILKSTIKRRHSSYLPWCKPLYSANKQVVESCCNGISRIMIGNWLPRNRYLWSDYQKLLCCVYKGSDWFIVFWFYHVLWEAICIRRLNTSVIHAPDVSTVMLYLFFSRLVLYWPSLSLLSSTLKLICSNYRLLLFLVFHLLCSITL